MGYLETFSDQDLKNTNLVLGVVGFGGAIVGLVVTGPAILGGVAIVGVASGWGQVAITEELRVRSGTAVNIDNSAFKFYILNQAINIPPAIVSTIGPVAKIVPGMRLTAGTMQLLDGVGAYLGLKLGPVGIGLNAVDVFSSCDNSGQVTNDNRLVGVRLDDSSFTQKESFVRKLEPNIISIPRTDPNGYYVKITIKSGDGWDKLEEIYGLGVRTLKEYNTVLNSATILEIPITRELRENIIDKLRPGDKYMSKIGVGGTYSDAQYATGINAVTLEENNKTKATDLQVGQNIVIIEVSSAIPLDHISQQLNQVGVETAVSGDDTMVHSIELDGVRTTLNNRMGEITKEQTELYSERDMIMGGMLTKLADEIAIVPAPNTFTFNSNFLLNQSGMNGFSNLNSTYFQLPGQQLLDMNNIAYLEKQSFNFENGIRCSNNITVQIGERSYKTELYVGDTA